MKRLFPMLAIPLAACSDFSDVKTVTDYLSPYRIDVRQGNYVTQEMVSQLKIGQTRDQVRFILGSPLVTDNFHADRWDYVYRFEPGVGEVKSRRLTVFFADGKLAKLGGDVAVGEPSKNDADAIISAPRIVRIDAPKPADGEKPEAPAETTKPSTSWWKWW